jgi:hypothetical protein
LLTLQFWIDLLCGTCELLDSAEAWTEATWVGGKQCCSRALQGAMLLGGVSGKRYICQNRCTKMGHPATDG